MKNINKIFAAVLAGSLLVGCNDLDVQPMGSTLTSSQKQEVAAVDPGKALASVTGICGMLGAAGSIKGDTQNYQWDFGHAAMFLTMDMRGMDMYSINEGYNWFLGAQRMNDGIPSDDDAYYMWRYNYNVILSCNSLMQTLRPTLDTEATDEAALTTRFFAAQALGFRAYSYLYLVQTFCATYNGHEGTPGVPVINDENADDAASNGCPRGTVAEVYAQIINDLDEAIACLEGNSLNPLSLVANKGNRFVTLPTAYGLRARANLLMNKWAEAESDAKAAIAAFKGAPISMEEAARPGFNSMDASNWMWGIAVAETDNIVRTGIVNFPSHMGSFSYGYATAVGAWKWINNKLYDAISSTDVRKGWWLGADGTSPNLNASQQAYADEIGMPAYVQVKFAPYKDVIDTDVNASDVPLMRVEEMYLIAAEALGMQNPAAGAAALNDFVRTYRDARYNCIATDTQTFREDIWNQRRIELWGEGFSYYDLLRFNKGVDRRGGGWPEANVFNVAADDPLLIYPIPQSEITANKQLSEADNIYGGGAPDIVAD